MNAAESLRIVCAIQQAPGFRPGDTAVALSAAREQGLSLDGLVSTSDMNLGSVFGWNASQVRLFRSYLKAPLERFQRFADPGVQVSTLMDDHYPVWAGRLPSTPWYFYMGDLAILEQAAIGFSGSRDASDEALEITRSLAIEAVKLGLTVVSGGARGIDMAAHTAALEAGGTTVVLVPQGLDTWWASGVLAEHAHRDRLLVMSEDLPWEQWATPSAMQRNRAIVDLSELVVIPQAGTTGGSAATGAYALRHKRSLWVADLGEAASGNQQLLQQGARPLLWSGDVPDLTRMRASGSTAVTQQSLF